MITLQEAIGQIRRWTDYPLYHSLSDGRIAELLVVQSDMAYNDLNLSGKPWTDQVFDVVLGPDEDYHTITEVGDFGTPWLVETENPSDLNHRVRAVTILDGETGVRFYNAGTIGADTQWNAYACSFGQAPGAPGQWAVRFAPKPAASGGRYKIHYFPSNIRPQALTDPVINFPEFEMFLMVGGLITAIGYCQWEGKSAEEGADKKKSLHESWDGVWSRLETQFVRQRRQQVQGQGMARIVPFGRTLRRRR